MILPLMTQRSWAEQSRKWQHRGEQSLILIALGLARSEVEMSLSCFLGISAHRVLAPAEPEVLVDSTQTLRDRWTAETDRQRQADRSMVFSVALVTSCRVLSCPLASKFLGCRPWVVSQLHSCPCPAFLAATALQCSAANIQNIDAPMRETARAHTLRSCVGMRLLVKMCRLSPWAANRLCRP